jgi:hypothetical protein
MGKCTLSMRSNLVPAETNIAELEAKAVEFELRAERELEPLATELRAEAKLCRAWIAELKSNRWTS